MSKKPIVQKKNPLKIISKFEVKSNVVARNKKHVNVKNKSLKASSKAWLNRHLNDEYRAKAEALGFRARSAFKLIEINEKFDIFNLGAKFLQSKSVAVNRVLDLGCAPGGWSQVLLQQTSAKVAGVDLLSITPLNGLEFIQGDFCSESVMLELSTKYYNFDLIVSDIAPNTSGNKSVDSLALIQILFKEWEFVKRFLNIGGCFVCKVFRSGAEQELLSLLKKNFALVKHFKPKSSRKESNEFYMICLQFNKDNI